MAVALTDEYADQLKSNFADFANVGGREVVHYGCGIPEQVHQGLKWAHLDVAGPLTRAVLRKAVRAANAVARRLSYPSRRPLTRNGVSHARQRRHVRFCRLERRKFIAARLIRR